MGCCWLLDSVEPGYVVKQSIYGEIFEYCKKYVCTLLVVLLGCPEVLAPEHIEQCYGGTVASPSC